MSITKPSSAIMAAVTFLAAFGSSTPALAAAPVLSSDGIAVPSPITPSLISKAISEARAAGAVTDASSGADGTRTVTIRAESGATLELPDPGADPHSRLSAGNDSYGFWIGFNSFDQGLIISGAGAGLTAGLCVLGPAVCAVATVAIVIATQAVTSNGGIQCGNKVMRVYPSGNHKPRCV